MSFAGHFTAQMRSELDNCEIWRKGVGGHGDSIKLDNFVISGLGIVGVANWLL